MHVEVWTHLPEVDSSKVRRLKREEYDRLVELGIFEHEHVELIRGSSFACRRRERPMRGRSSAAMGVPEYWVVDVTTRAIEVYRRPCGDRYEESTVLRAGASIALVAFPDISVEVSAIVP